MKDGCLSKLTITESSNRAIQLKKIVDTLSVYCADKGYRYIDDIICANTELLEAAFLPVYLDAALWSNTYHGQIKTLNSTVAPDAYGVCPSIIKMEEKTHIFNSNLQKQLLADSDQKSKIKSQEWAKLISDKKSLITIIFGQCDGATRTKIVLSTNEFPKKIS